MALSLHNAIVQAQLKSVKLMALVIAGLVVIGLLLQLSLLNREPDPRVTGLISRQSEFNKVLTGANTAVIAIIARWTVEFGLGLQVDKSNQAQLPDGRLLALHEFVCLIRAGQRIDPISGLSIGPMPSYWQVLNNGQTAVITEKLGTQESPASVRYLGGKTLIFALDEMAYAVSIPNYSLGWKNSLTAVILLTGGSFLITYIGLRAMTTWLGGSQAEGAASDIARSIEALVQDFRQAGTESGLTILKQPSQLVRSSNLVGAPLEIQFLHLEFNLMRDRLAKSMAEQQSALVAQRNFLVDAAHELRTPLTILRGHTEFIANDDSITLKNDRTQSMLVQIDDMSSALNDLLTAAQLEIIGHAVECVAIDAVKCVRSLVQQMSASTWRSGVLLRVAANLQATNATAYADERRLRQVIGGLISNSLRHTKSGGFIELSVECQANEITISVVDSGEGISEQELAHVMKRGYSVISSQSSAQPMGRRTGLGLAIANELVMAMGGSLSIESELGVGTTVHINLVRPSSHCD